MAVKRFIKRNNKKITCLIALLLVCAVSIVAIISSKTTNASVFKKDKDGNVVRRDTLTVLEIVAQEGQQVIGYTVSGYEPTDYTECKYGQNPPDMKLLKKKYPKVFIKQLLLTIFLKIHLI